MIKFLLSILLLSGLHLPAMANQTEEKYPVVILGGGVGALTSATYLARGGIQPLVITGPVIGGTITMSHAVQNWPGEMSISGEALSEKLYKQAEYNGALLRPEIVVGVDFSHRPFTITTRTIFGEGESDLKRYKTDACIIALGSTPNFLDVPGEEKYWTRGVYTCAVCDGALFKDKIVAVVGGGDSALTEVQYLSNLVKKVYLIVRGSEMRTVEKRRAQEILSRPNVEVMYESTIEEIKGSEEKMTHLVVHDKRKNATAEIVTNALFLAIGSHPNTELFSHQLELDKGNYIALKKNQQTSVEGVYAIGDVADPEFKQAVSAAGDGAKAALQAQKFLTSYCPNDHKAMAQDVPQEIKKGVVEIASREHFEKLIKEAKGAVFVDFYSARCGPCRMFKPVFESWARDFQEKILFLQVSAEKVEELFDIYRIQAVPTLVIVDSKGEMIRKSIGPREISKVEKVLQKFKEKQEITAQDFK
ncbi:MAG TPA: FAD-dependent oxidoreductase [Rhabdochlamydiaceae bacterium]|jgi:thioredoxin reductase (NADPH)